jgi:diguanylate cyclase (GGDEF)-like protein
VEAAPIPDGDEARVAALRRLGLLDSPPEERFDRITRTAQRLFGVDTALVTLVDADRQWFKSRQGLDVTETPRDVSFCGHAIAGHEIFEVEDPSVDPRFADNPLVLGHPNVGFYAGCPIAGPNGEVIGTLCLVDHSPRVLDGDERESLRDLAGMVEREIAVSQLAVDDELTGLANRRGFLMMAHQALAFCERQHLPALVVYADVDGLKVVNDRSGHDSGDQLLRHAGSVMAEAFRGSDVVGRLGGDEFAAVLTAFEGDEAWALSRLAMSVEACNQALVGAPYAVSLSVGTVRFDPDDPELLESLLQQADASMYLDKLHRRQLAR